MIDPEIPRKPSIKVNAEKLIKQYYDIVKEFLPQTEPTLLFDNGGQHKVILSLFKDSKLDYIRIDHTGTAYLVMECPLKSMLQDVEDIKDKLDITEGKDLLEQVYLPSNDPTPGTSFKTVDDYAYLIVTTPLQVKVHASGQEVMSAIMKGRDNIHRHLKLFLHAMMLGIAYSQYHLI